MTSFQKSLAAASILSAIVLGLCLPSARAAEKIYWHITMQAHIDDGRAEEWLWVTMVEMAKADAFPDLAETVKSAGGAIPGTILAHVRGAAWRSDFTASKPRKCDGRPDKIMTFWKSSWSDKVYGHGRILNPSRHVGNILSHFDFKFGLCDQKVLMEDGRELIVANLVEPLLGDINQEGPPDEVTGDVRVHGISYDDMLVHYKFCGRSWAEQAKTPLMHYEMDNLQDGFVDTPDRIFGVRVFKSYGRKADVEWLIVRSTSREHPDWKQKRFSRPAER